MVIKNGYVVTEDSVLNTDVRIENGVISQIGDNLSGGEIIDAAGKYVLPGGIDVHTHFCLDAGIAVAQDDFYTGTVAAACGGTTTIVDHPAFGPAGCALDHQINLYHTLAAGNAVIDYSFHGVMQHVDADVLDKMETLADEGITSLKIYMTYGFKMSDEDIYHILLRAKELGVMIAVHPENDGLVNTRRKELSESGYTAPEYHAVSRPEPCEAEAINRVIQISAVAGDAPLYIVHLSNHLGMQYIRLAKQNGIHNLFVETCPQYLVLDDSCYKREDGLKYILSPPLRHKANNALLWADIQLSEIDTIATDHCPFDFTLKQKLGGADFTKCPNGMPGVELRIPLMFSEGVMKNRVSPVGFARLCATNPAKLFGMYPKKGTLRVGSDADIVIIDPGKEYTIAHDRLHENVDHTPYEGIKLQCDIDCVISRGDVIVKHNEFAGQKGRGQFLKRGKPMLSVNSPQ
jgi:dihydropyrimidinase